MLLEFVILVRDSMHAAPAEETTVDVLAMFEYMATITVLALGGILSLSETPHFTNLFRLSVRWAGNIHSLVLILCS